MITLYYVSVALKTFYRCPADYKVALFIKLAYTSNNRLVVPSALTYHICGLKEYTMNFNEEYNKWNLKISRKYRT